MTLQTTHTCFPDGTVSEHGNIEEILLWDLVKDWRREQAKKKRTAKIIDWSSNKFKSA